MINNQPSTSTDSKRINGVSKWAWPAVLAVLVIIIALFPVFIDSRYVLHISIMIFTYVIVTVSMRTIIISGQFTLAHAAFMGIGAYAAGMASKWLGWPPWLTIPSAAILTAGIGMLMAYPFCRLRALYFAMGSLFFGIAVVWVILAGGLWTGASIGLSGISPLFPHTTSKVPYFYFFLGLALFSIIALYRFEFCRIGVTLKAIAQSHLVASSVGISESVYRIMVTGVGCFFAGLAGATYAHYNLALAPNTFFFIATLWLALYVLVGGVNSFAGPIIGTVIMILIPEFARDMKMYSPFALGALLLIVFFLLPQGLVSLPQLVRSRFIESRKNRSTNHAG
jgi:branched-chain amino acid transport system permease protein